MPFYAAVAVVDGFSFSQDSIILVLHDYQFGQRYQVVWFAVGIGHIHGIVFVAARGVAIVYILHYVMVAVVGLVRHRHHSGSGVAFVVTAQFHLLRHIDVGRTFLLVHIGVGHTVPYRSVVQRLDKRTMVGVLYHIADFLAPLVEIPVVIALHHITVGRKLAAGERMLAGDHCVEAIFNALVAVVVGVTVAVGGISPVGRQRCRLVVGGHLGEYPAALGLLIAGFSKFVPEVNSAAGEIGNPFQEVCLARPVVAHAQVRLAVGGDVVGIAVAVDVHQLGTVAREGPVVRGPLYSSADFQ